jgi:hypothetical protein
MAQNNPTDPKAVQQALRVASALANPHIEEQNWTMLKERFKLNDTVLVGLKKIIEVSKDSPEMKLILQCLTFNVKP